MVCGRVGVLHSRGHDLTRLSPADGDAKLATAVWGSSPPGTSRSPKGSQLQAWCFTTPVVASMIPQALVTVTVVQKYSYPSCDINRYANASDIGIVVSL